MPDSHRLGVFIAGGSKCRDVAMTKLLILALLIAVLLYPVWGSYFVNDKIFGRQKADESNVKRRLRKS